MIDRLDEILGDCHMVAGGLHEGRSVEQCSATVSKAIEEAI